MTLSVRAFCCSCSAFLSSDSAHNFIKTEGSVYLFTQAPSPSASNLGGPAIVLNPDQPQDPNF